MRRITARLRPAVVVAFLLGVVIATAGSATAAKLITGKSIKDGSLTLKDFKRSEIRKLRGKQGPAGTAGLAGRDGADGFDGTDGEPGLAGLVEVLSDTMVAAPNTTIGAFAKCPAGKTPIAGGHMTSGPTMNIVDSRAGRSDGLSGPRDSWVVAMSNPSGAPQGTFKAYAICATVPGGLPQSP